MVPNGQSPEEINARIAKLERELSQLRRLATAENKPTPQQQVSAARLVPIKHDPKQNTDHEASRWLSQTLSRLLEDDSDTSIIITLQSLATELDLYHCSLRLLDHNTDSLIESHCWPTVQDTDDQSSLELQKEFSSLNLQQYPKLKALINRDQPLYYADINADQMLDSRFREQMIRSGVSSMAVIPLRYQNQTDAVLTLLGNRSDDDWNYNRINCAKVIGEALTHCIRRKEVSQQLRERDIRYSYAMQASRDGIWDLDLTTGLLYMSPSFTRMLGYEPGELPPSYADFKEKVIHPDDLRRFGEDFQRTDKKQDNNNSSYEVRLKHKQGHYLWIYSRSKLFDLDENGNYTRCVGINADITQFKKDQAALRQAKIEATSANQTKNNFLARMSHEIRTPMNAIIGMAHLLKDTLPTEQQLNYISSIDQSAESLLHIINDILDFSKLESGKLLLENNHINLENIFEQLACDIKPKAEAKTIEIIFDIDDTVPRFIKGDKQRIQQILANLTDNAIKFTNCGGEVTLRARQLNETPASVVIEFTVIDTGIGIDPAQLQSLFDPFSQADESSSRRFGGTGLGLTISKQLIDQMGGTIHVNSNPGQGSCFIFTASFAKSQMGERAIQIRPERYKNLRTLIVDDHPSSLKILQKTAKSLQLHTELAVSAIDALHQLENAAIKPDSHYQLVVMDYQMPHLTGLDGAELIYNNRDIPHKPKILLVSNYRQSEITELQPIKYIDGFINKPVTSSRLLDGIASAFGESLFEQEPQQWPQESSDTAREPCTDSAHTEYHTEILERDHVSLKGLSVLLAEDNLINQKVAAGILQKKGMKVVIANNGKEAIDILYAHPEHTFAVILMDMEMPEMDGYQATKVIRTGHHCAQIPIIALTAHAMPGDRDRCITTGMNDYVTKPIKPSDLYATLLKFTDGNKAPLPERR